MFFYSTLHIIGKKYLFHRIQQTSWLIQTMRNFEDDMSKKFTIIQSYHRFQDFTVSYTLLCPAHNCVQKIMCPHLPKRSFVHLSHVDMMRSYHARLRSTEVSRSCRWCLQFVPYTNVNLLLIAIRKYKYLLQQLEIRYFAEKSP